MAIREIRVDDLDNTEDDTVALHTIAIDGSAWEIDLSEENVNKLHKLLEPYKNAGRPAGRGAWPMKWQGAHKPASRRGSSTSEDYPREAVRSWAKEQGLEVGERGRIKADIVMKWREAGSPGA